MEQEPRLWLSETELICFLDFPIGIVSEYLMTREGSIIICTLLMGNWGTERLTALHKGLQELKPFLHSSTLAHWPLGHPFSLRDRGLQSQIQPGLHHSLSQGQNLWGAEHPPTYNRNLWLGRVIGVEGPLPSRRPLCYSLKQVTSPASQPVSNVSTINFTERWFFPPKLSLLSVSAP